MYGRQGWLIQRGEAVSRLMASSNRGDSSFNNFREERARGVPAAAQSICEQVPKTSVSPQTLGENDVSAAKTAEAGFAGSALYCTEKPSQKLWCYLTAEQSGRHYY